MTALDIRDLLMAKHAKYGDICIPECYAGGHRIDLFVICKSGIDIAYEIKVSRSDFNGDNKWQEYLGYCNEFYFATPLGIIGKDELPPEAGLIVVTSTGSSMRIRKKAQRRTIETPVSFYRKIITNRLLPKGQQKFLQISHKKEYWEEWLENRKIDATFGWKVSKKLGETVREEILKVRDKNVDLMYENKKLQDIKKMLLEMGMTEEDFDDYQWSFREKAQKLVESLPADFKETLVKLRDQIDATLERSTP